MKIIRNNDFVMRQIAGETFLIPVGEASVKFNGMITLNNISAFIWKELETEKSGDELVKAVLDVYDVEEAEAREDIMRFLDSMKSMNMIQYL